jgi:hypothetical protein
VAGIDRATLLDRTGYTTAWTGRPADGLDLVDDAIALVDPAAEPVRARAAAPAPGHLPVAARARNRCRARARASGRADSRPATLG